MFVNSGSVQFDSGLYEVPLNGDCIFNQKFQESPGRSSANCAEFDTFKCHGLHFTYRTMSLNTVIYGIYSICSWWIWQIVEHDAWRLSQLISFTSIFDQIFAQFALEWPLHFSNLSFMVQSPLYWYLTCRKKWRHDEWNRVTKGSKVEQWWCSEDADDADLAAHASIVWTVRPTVSISAVVMVPEAVLVAEHFRVIFLCKGSNWCAAVPTIAHGSRTIGRIPHTVASTPSIHAWEARVEPCRYAGLVSDN